VPPAPDPAGNPPDPEDPKEGGDDPQPGDNGKAVLARVTDDIARVLGVAYKDAAAMVVRHLDAREPDTPDASPRTLLLELVANGRFTHPLVTTGEAEALLAAKPRKWSREPTALEAAHVSLAEIDVVIDAQRLRFQRALTTRAHAVARHLAERTLPDEAEEVLRADVRDALHQLVEYGRASVWSELASQRGVPPTALNAPKDQGRVDGWITRQARRATTAILGRLEQHADRLRSRVTDVAFAQLVGALEDEADRALRAEALGVVSQAFNAGRRFETDAAGGDAVYSSVLDSATCNPCRSLDGRDYQVGSPEYERDYPPLLDCDGGGACRCMMVIVLPSEVP
jgi:hypothetical protein